MIPFKILPFKLFCLSFRKEWDDVKTNGTSKIRFSKFRRKKKKTIARARSWNSETHFISNGFSLSHFSAVYEKWIFEGDGNRAIRRDSMWKKGASSCSIGATINFLFHYYYFVTHTPDDAHNFGTNKHHLSWSLCARTAAMQTVEHTNKSYRAHVISFSCSSTVSTDVCIYCVTPRCRWTLFFMLHFISFRRGIFTIYPRRLRRHSRLYCCLRALRTYFMLTVWSHIKE